jgi:hypothetical protein
VLCWVAALHQATAVKPEPTIPTLRWRIIIIYYWTALVAVTIFGNKMADNQFLDNDGVGGDDEIFVYTGGDQEVPLDVRRLRIAENVDTIPAGVFYRCRQLIKVEGHNKLKKIEHRAFKNCRCLRRVTKMTGVIEIEAFAFGSCWDLSDIDFTKLEIIGHGAFGHCYPLKSINLPSVRRVDRSAFSHCTAITDAVLGKDLERIEQNAFIGCPSLRRIAIPLKDNSIIGNKAFYSCKNLSRVDVVDGGINKTISSLHLESWRTEMQEEIDRINQTLPNTHSHEKTRAIQQWITRVLDRMEHYKTEHQIILKEAMTILELALWKARLLANEAEEKKCNVDIMAKAKIDAGGARKEHRVTCGASIVIKNVLPFLALE